MAVFTTEVQLRFGDLDVLAHVNNVAHLELLEEARFRFLSTVLTEISGLVVVRHEIDYPKPLLYSTDPVTVAMWVERVGGSSFTVGYEVVDPQGSVVVRAKTVVVSVEVDGSAAAPLPEQAKVALRGYLRA